MFILSSEAWAASKLSKLVLAIFKAACLDLFGLISIMSLHLHWFSESGEHIGCPAFKLFSSHLVKAFIYKGLLKGSCLLGEVSVFIQRLHSEQPFFVSTSTASFAGLRRLRHLEHASAPVIASPTSSKLEPQAEVKWKVKPSTDLSMSFSLGN